MKYRVTTTTADHVNGHTYGSARAALNVYNNIRALFSRLGYTIADAGNGHNCRAELWIKEGFVDRNIEIWPVTGEAAARMEADHAARVEVAADYLSKGATVEDWTRPGRYIVALDEFHRVNISAAELDEAKAKATAPAPTKGEGNDSQGVAAYIAECSRKVADTCTAAKYLIKSFCDDFITADELRSEIANITANKYTHQGDGIAAA